MTVIVTQYALTRMDRTHANAKKGSLVTAIHVKISTSAMPVLVEETKHAKTQLDLTNALHVVQE